jgi:hypothetical protein
MASVFKLNAHQQSIEFRILGLNLLWSNAMAGNT